MPLKIKWNDHRVRGTATALLLISRDLIARGEGLENLVAAALAEYRDDPAGYKMNKEEWPEVRAMGPLKKPAQISAYTRLTTAVEAVLKKIEQNQRQSNSLVELDNYFVACLRDFHVR